MREALGIGVGLLCTWLSWQSNLPDWAKALVFLLGLGLIVAGLLGLIFAKDTPTPAHITFNEPAKPQEPDLLIDNHDTEQLEDGTFVHTARLTIISPFLPAKVTIRVTGDGITEGRPHPTTGIISYTHGMVGGAYMLDINQPSGVYEISIFTDRNTPINFNYRFT